MDGIWFLISGSRNATPAMIKHARAVVHRCKEHDYTVIVGDNPKGVDRAVVEACYKLGLKPVICFPGEINRVELTINNQRIPGNNASAEDYRHRDEIMCDMADLGYFIWDGESLGTKHAWDYFTGLYNKKGWLVDFETGKPYTVPFESGPKPEIQVEQIPLF